MQLTVAGMYYSLHIFFSSLNLCWSSGVFKKEHWRKIYKKQIYFKCFTSWELKVSRCLHEFSFQTKKNYLIFIFLFSSTKIQKKKEFESSCNNSRFFQPSSLLIPLFSDSLNFCFLNQKSYTIHHKNPKNHFLCVFESAVFIKEISQNLQPTHKYTHTLYWIKCIA